jgi:ABC-type uncharacterized transport system substrate-binding protein
VTRLGHGGPPSNTVSHFRLRLAIRARLNDPSQGIGARRLPSSISLPPRSRTILSIWLESVEAAATPLGVQITAAPIRAAADVEAAISTIAALPNGGLIVQPDAYTSANRRLIIDLTARYRLPAVYAYARYSAEGGLVSYGPDQNDLFRRSASYIDRILKGEQPANLPVQQPLKYELAINVKTAKALGLTVPPGLLVAADEVIE